MVVLQERKAVRNVIHIYCVNCLAEMACLKKIYPAKLSTEKQNKIDTHKRSEQTNFIPFMTIFSSLKKYQDVIMMCLAYI